MSYQIQIFSADSLPAELKWQILSFMRVQWPEGFRDQWRGRNWIARPDFHPLHFVLTEESTVISHTEVLWTIFHHAGAIYTVFGLSGVFTFPDRQREGCGRRIVEAATRYIQQTGRADLAMLWCDPHNRDFYIKCGWEYIEGAKTFVTDANGTDLSSELLLMLFFSDKGKSGKSAFQNEPIFFGDTTW